MPSDTPNTPLAIVCQRIALRRLTIVDAPDVAAYRADHEVARYQSWAEYTLADAEALCRSQQDAQFGAPGSWCQLAIVRTGDALVIGDCGMHFADDGSAQLEIGFTLSRAEQGKGYATEAIAGVLDCAFTTLTRHRVTARIDARNSAARALLGRLGFRREGVFLECAMFKGAWCDEEIHAVLAREWGGHPLAGRSRVIGAPPR